ncbi:MAG: transposase domain-containing protein [Sedimentisphaerales bacterium]
MIEQSEQNSALSEIPANKRDEAIRRVGTVKDFEDFAARTIRENGTRSEAFAVYSRQHNIPLRTLQRWIANYRDEGITGLVDMRGRGEGNGDTISEEAFDLFKSMYLDQRRLSLKMCWQNIRYENRRQKKGWTIPNLRTMYNLVNRRIPLPVQILHREGQAAYDAKCAPYIQTNPDSIEPGQIWVGDHSQFNCWIRHKGQWIRPWLTAWEDMRSRVIVGWHISLSPNQTTILLAMKKGIKVYGPPDSVHIDNGRDYDSEMWTGTTKAVRKVLRKGYIDKLGLTGLYAMMKIAVSFAIPYHPQSKPIERFFDTCDCQFTKTVPTYCGKDTERKPDYLKDLLASQKVIDGALDLDKFAGLFERYIEVYNNSSHSGVGMDGRSPAQVLATRASKRIILDDVLGLLARGWSRELKVGKNGVNFKGIHFGQYDTDLLACYGKSVRLAYDPDDLRRVDIYDAATLKLITIAEQNQFINYGSAANEGHLRNAMQQKSRALKMVKGYRDSSRIANTDLTSLTIEAMQTEQITSDKELANPMLRPVPTPLDGQVSAHKQLRAKAKLSARPKEEPLAFDFSILQPKKFVPDPEFAKALEEGLKRKIAMMRAKSA